MADDDDRRPRIREREGLLSPSFLSISIYHDRRSESNPARVHNNNNNNNNNDDGSSGGGGDNDSSRSTFSTSRPILPFTVTPALDPSVLSLSLTKTGQGLRFSPSDFFPSISLLLLSSVLVHRVPFTFFFFFRLSPPAHSVYLASISPCSRYSRVKHGREGDQTTTHAHALHLPKPRRLIRLRICDVSRVALGRAALP